MKKRFLVSAIILLSIMIGGCEKEETNTGNPPEAKFDISLEIAEVDEVVSFTDKSLNYPTSWSWSFGDGNTSTEQNPEHSYQEVGKYTIQLAVTNVHGTDTEIKSDLITIEQKEYSVTDIDGNIYKAVKIGDQIWMAENLRVTHMPDGTTIQYVTDDYTWSELRDEYADKAYCYYLNDTTVNRVEYGALYTWATVMNSSDTKFTSSDLVQGICPDGWHVPSTDEYWEMINHLGGKYLAAAELKEEGNSHWLEYNTDATNSTGFTARPGGYRHGANGSFYTLGYFGYWWTTTEEYNVNAYNMVMNNMNSEIDNEGQFKSGGRSLRCVKD